MALTAWRTVPGMVRGWVSGIWVVPGYGWYMVVPFLSVCRVCSGVSAGFVRGNAQGAARPDALASGRVGGQLGRGGRPDAEQPVGERPERDAPAGQDHLDLAVADAQPQERAARRGRPGVHGEVAAAGYQPAEAPPQSRWRRRRLGRDRL